MRKLLLYSGLCCVAWSSCPGGQSIFINFWQFLVSFTSRKLGTPCQYISLSARLRERVEPDLILSKVVLISYIKGLWRSAVLLANAMSLNLRRLRRDTQALLLLLRLFHSKVQLIDSRHQLNYSSTSYLLKGCLASKHHNRA